ncbi:MAG: hypothetical protein NUK65_13350 [Firmicutes bacterium]|nr:hypothetical protein [Bacillota bacterium]
MGLRAIAYDRQVAEEQEFFVFTTSATAGVFLFGVVGPLQKNGGEENEKTFSKNYYRGIGGITMCEQCICHAIFAANGR